MQEKITDFLSKTQEATAKKIAAGIGESDAQSSVNSALNSMRTDGVVECEKRKGKGNELVYWLAKPVCTNPQDDPITRRAPVRDEVSDLRLEVEELKRNLDTAGGSAELNRMRIAELEKDVHLHSSGLQEASSSIIRFLIATQQITGMEHKPATMQEAEQQIAATIRLMQGRVEELEQTIHQMELAGAQSADAVDVKDAAVGYLVRIPKRKLRLCVKPESAREAALSGARVYGRADVLALVPVGKAVRGAEWKDSA